MNSPLRTPAIPREQGHAALSDEVGVIVLFSGGGARSAAYGFGILKALSRTRTARGHALTEAVDVVGGVSGGAVLAAYFSLKGASGFSAFRRDFLRADPERDLRMEISPVNLVRGYRGGVNDVSGLPAWLDRHLYGGATLGDLPARPRLLLHATDLYNRLPFFFDKRGFSALCSDERPYPLALAVAASAAVPVAFAPVVLRNYSATCPARLMAPGKRRDPGATLLEQEVDRARQRFAHDPSIRYLKLYDGGLVDGTGALSLAEAMRQPAPYPLTEERARDIRHLLVIVVDASTRWGGSLSETAALPTAPDTLVAAVDAMINIPNMQGIERLEPALSAWARRLARWRCPAKGKDGCTPPTIDLVRIALSDRDDPGERTRILGLHNRLSLQPKDTFFLETLAGTQLRRDPRYRAFLRRTGARELPDGDEQ